MTMPETAAAFVRSVFTKISEWGLAVIIFIMGWGLLAPGATFGYSGNLWPYLSVTSEKGWALLMIGTGAASIAALWVNGASPKMTSRARVICAIARSMVWTVSALVFIQAAFALGSFISSAAIYPVFILMEWAVVIRAAWESKNAI